jgi:hypothetical protein
VSAYISAIALARKFYIAHILTRLCDATVAVRAGDEPFNAREWWSGSAEYWSGMAELWSRITIADQCRQNPAYRSITNVGKVLHKHTAQSVDWHTLLRQCILTDTKISYNHRAFS